MSHNCLVLTGSSGAIGSHIVRHSRHIASSRAFCIVRSPRSFEMVREAAGPAAARLTPIFADVSSQTDMARAAAEIGRWENAAAVHCAGDVSWTKSARLLRPVNVEGAVNVAKLMIQVSHCRPSLVFLSTAFADESIAARNAYEQTKLEAEHELLTIDARQLGLAIIRCSLVVGASSDGSISRFNGLYPLIRIVALAEVPCVIAEPDYKVDVVDVGYVGEQVDLALEQLGDAASPLRLIAAAGDGAMGIRPLVTTILSRTNKFRNDRGLDDLPEVSVVTSRQYRFLMGASKNWGLEKRFSRVEQISDLMSGYIRHGETGRAIKPVFLCDPPPEPSAYMPAVIDYWLSVNERRILADRQPEWKGVPVPSC